MTIDGDTLLRIATLAIAIGGGLYSWVTSQGKAAAHEIAALKSDLASFRADLSSVSGRTAKIEGEMVHLPDKDMVHRIELGMKDMQSRIEAQAEVVKAVERTMQRVESFLLEAQQRPAPVARRK